MDCCDDRLDYPTDRDILFEKLGAFFQWTWSAVCAMWLWRLCWWVSLEFLFAKMTRQADLLEQVTYTRRWASSTDYFEAMASASV
jgi:hypothetical protein